jgi:hypothetical protein
MITVADNDPDLCHLGLASCGVFAITMDILGSTPWA